MPKWIMDSPRVPLIIRFAGTATGGYLSELSGPSGVLEILLVEPETYYVSVSHSTIRYEVEVLGWKDSRGQDR